MATGRKFFELYDFESEKVKQSKESEMDIYHIVYVRESRMLLAGGKSNAILEF